MYVCRVAVEITKRPNAVPISLHLRLLSPEEKAHMEAHIPEIAEGDMVPFLEQVREFD